MESYAAQLVSDLDAETYQWFAGRKIYQSNNRKRMQAIKKIGRIYGITHDQKNKERDLQKAIAKHVLWLKEMKAKAEKALETGIMRFY